MSEYIPMSETAMETSSKEWLQSSLREAQAEIERLSGDDQRLTPKEKGRLRGILSGKARAEMWATDRPPKDLSDPYPKDGPNVREQERYRKLSEWMLKVDKRVAALADEVTRHKESQLVLDDTPIEHHSLFNSLETRLTALSETVAKNRKSYEADRGQHHHESRKDIKDRIEALEKRVMGRVERRTRQRRVSNGRRVNMEERRLAGWRRTNGERRRP